MLKNLMIFFFDDLLEEFKIVQKSNPSFDSPETTNFSKLWSFPGGKFFGGITQHESKTMNPQTTNPSTNRQTKTRAKPSCFNPCQGRFGHRHNGTEVLKRRGFPVWTCRWHFYWHLWWNESKRNISFSPQKTIKNQTNQFFEPKKTSPQMLSPPSGGNENETMTNWYELYLDFVFFEFTAFSCERLLKFEYIYTFTSFFFPCFFPSLDDFSF